MIDNFNQFILKAHTLTCASNEGIDIYKKNVTLNFNHEKGVNTSVSVNPLKYTLDGLDAQIYSIFTRNKSEEANDGNPLIYGMKDLFNWKISESDKKELYVRTKKIAEKISQELQNQSVILSIPSSNSLNKEFAEVINSVFNKEIIYDDVLIKLPKDEVYKSISPTTPAEARKELDIAFAKMGDSFKFKEISPKYREYITNIYKTNKKSTTGAAATAVASLPEDLDKLKKIDSLIRGKNIIILDDTISSGSTIKLFVKELQSLYNPKSITIITLFSKIVDKSGKVFKSNKSHEYDSTGTRKSK
jgi:ribosomal protein S17E